MNNDRPKLAISFSGGRTSAYMPLHCLKQFDSTHDIAITFANTGCEYPATLDFVNECDKVICGRVVWLEAVVNSEHGKGITHKRVTYETASRNGEPFEAYIAKYGIPNATNKACTNRLKQDVMEDYLQGIGYLRGKRLNYDTAIGIRFDEIDRVSPTYREQRLVYPLVDSRVTRGMVNEFWKTQPFDLQIPGDHYGNCVWCWKKSLRKLLTVAKHTPEWFDFPKRMEEQYGHIKADSKAGKNGRRVFFRGYLSSQNILDASKKFMKVYVESRQVSLLDFEYDHDLDIGSSCGESCEIGSDESDQEGMSNAS